MNHNYGVKKFSLHSVGKKKMLISHLDVFFFYCSIMQGKWYLKSHNPSLKALVSFYSSGANAICYERHVTVLDVSSNKQSRVVVHVNVESPKFSIGNCGEDKDLKPQEELQIQRTQSVIEGDTCLHKSKLTK